jgi:predicted ATPase/class 3 adenylate cyclase
MARPATTVTFLFSDIEGSTRLLRDLGERYADALEDHRRLLRAAFAAHGGDEQGTEGDSFFVVFRRASDALAAALDGQRALAAHTWPDDHPIRVRMGIHTGEALLAHGGYVGLAVHEAARLMSAGHGGQVLVSEAARQVAEPNLPLGTTLRELGAHRFKDFDDAQPVHQLCHPGLEDRFPALRTLSTVPNNLPATTSTFIGREDDLTQIDALIGRRRLVTLTGPGGVGKTRLALEATGSLVADFDDGVWLVELAPIGDGALVPQALATALGLRERSGVDLVEVLVDWASRHRAVVVLDNCEHLLDAAARLAELLLTAGPSIQVVATSREPLGVPGEAVWRVPPMDLPDPGDPGTAAANEAVRLFVDRARSAHATADLAGATSDIARVCTGLDGIPLAIELAAARASVLTPRQIAERLDDRLRLLTGGARTRQRRQQTLRAAIDWSHDLLADAERRAFRRLAVFAGGFDLDAAEAVCAFGTDERPDVLPVLAGLVDRSLVIAETGAVEARYRLLETIGVYAAERLADAGEADGARHRHARWYVGLAEQAVDELAGPEQPRWTDRLETEHDNLRAALATLVAEPATRDDAVRLAGALVPFWFLRGHLSEGRSWLEAALATGGGSARDRVRALHGAAVLALLQGDADASEANGGAALDAAREAGDRTWEARSILHLAGDAAERGHLGRASEGFAEALSLAESASDAPTAATASNGLGGVAWMRGDLRAARSHMEDGLERRRRMADQRAIAASLNNLAGLDLTEGDAPAARSLAEESLVISQQLGDREGIATALANLGEVAEAEGDLEDAVRLTTESLRLVRDIGERPFAAMLLVSLARLAHRAGRSEEAAVTLGQVDALHVPPAPGQDELVDELLAELGATRLDAARRRGSGAGGGDAER